MSFLDELKENTRSDDVVNELLRQREELQDQLITAYAQDTCERIKATIMSQAERGDFENVDGKKSIKGILDTLSFHGNKSAKLIHNECANLNMELQQHGLTRIDKILNANIYQDTQIISEIHTKKILFFNLKRNQKYQLTTIKPIDGNTAIFLTRLKDLAKQDNIQIGIFATRYYSNSEEIIEFDDSFHSSFSIKTPIYNDKNPPSVFLSTSSIKIKYSVLY